jgi:hypothetical protein
VQQSLSGITLFGQVQIDKLASTASATVGPDQPGQATGNVTVGRVTVVGQQAAIDQQGIHLLGQSAPLPPPASGSGTGSGLPLPGVVRAVPAPAPPAAAVSPAQQFLSQLQAAGITIRLLTADDEPGDGQVAYRSSAVEVSEKLPDGTTVSIVLGQLSLDATSHSESGLGAGFLFDDIGGVAAGSAAEAPASGGGAVGTALNRRLVSLLTTPHAVLYGLLALFLLSSLMGSVIGTLRPGARPRAATLVRL